MTDLIARLRAYVQHKASCPRWTAPKQHSTECAMWAGFHEHRYLDDANAACTCALRYSISCACGLDALLAEATPAPFVIICRCEDLRSDGQGRVRNPHPKCPVHSAQD